MANYRKRSGRWQVRISNVGQPAISKTFDTKVDAELWARSMQRDIDLGGYKPKAVVKLTVAELIDHYLKQVVPKFRGANTEVYRLETIRKALGRIALASLTPAHIARFRDQRLQSVSPSTVVRELQSLSAMLNYGRKEMSLQIGNSVELVRKPKPNRARDRRLHPNEEKRLLAVLSSGGQQSNGQWRSGTRNPWIRQIVEFALETAMRRSELLAMVWHHFLM